MLNLSKVKRIAFINDFNPKKSYPEFGNKTIVKATVNSIKETIVVKEPRLPKAGTFALKQAKASYKKAVGANYKPKLIVKSSVN